MPFINGIGPFELVIILVIALIVVGPGRLPDVGAALGKSIREFRKAATDVKDATSLDPVKTETAPPVADAQPPAVSEAAAPAEAAAPYISELPEPAPVADEQPTRTA